MVRRSETMMAAERLAQIQAITDDRTFVTVNQLSDLLNVSEITIRRDLSILEEQGGLERTHGGAKSLRSAPDVPFAMRTEREVGAKRAIGEAAAALVEEGEVIFLNAGSTILAMARALAGRHNLTVVTNAYTIVPVLANAPHIQLVVTGGMARQQTGSLVGPIAERMVSELRVDRAFLGATGVDMAAGITNSSLDEVELQRAVIRIAGAVYVLADHTKFGKVSFARAAPLAALVAVVTDGQIAEETRATYAAHVNLVLAKS